MLATAIEKDAVHYLVMLETLVFKPLENPKREFNISSLAKTMQN